MSTHDETDHDQELTQRLGLLADRLPTGPVDVGADLARGRRRVRRRRGAAGLATLATVAAVTLAAVVLPGGTDPRGRGPGISDQGSAAPTPSVAIDSASAAPVTERELAFGDALDLDSASDQRQAAVEGFARVVAERLDPEGEHAVLPTENSLSGGGWLGTRMGWRQPGESGEGLVEIHVGRRPGSAEWRCAEAGWTCSDLAPPAGASTARLARHDDVVEVMVSRPDGFVVTLAAGLLFGNNSVVPISDLGLSVEQLAAAATDPRLVLPVITAASPDRLRSQEQEDRVLALGQEVLFAPAPGETARFLDGGDQGGGSYSGLFSEGWTGPTGAGTVAWFVDDDPSARLNATCVKRWFSRCVVHTEAGREIFVGHERGGTGWRIYAPGPVSTVSITFTRTGRGQGYPIDRAIAFALDPRLQQTLVSCPDCQVP